MVLGQGMFSVQHQIITDPKADRMRPALWLLSEEQVFPLSLPLLVFLLSLAVSLSVK